MGRRITRKQLKKDDEFVSAAEVIFRWVADNARPLAAAILAVCVVALLWWAISGWMSSRTDDASLLLYHATQTFEGEAAPGSLAPAGDIEAAEAEFQQVIDSYGRSEQADMARLYLARIALSRGETDEARTALVGLAEKHGDDVVGRLANLDLINLRIASGQGTEVAAELEAMVTGRSTGLPRDAALYRLGELFVEEGQPEKARTYLQMLVEEFPESPFLPNARQRLLELGQ
jgi:predicted negative regulator of RcsB-dependent stress response